MLCACTERGIKVVAVNDPFIDPEYMASGRQGAGSGRAAQEKGLRTDLWKAPSTKWGFPYPWHPKTRSHCISHRCTCSRLTPPLADSRGVWKAGREGWWWTTRGSVSSNGKGSCLRQATNRLVQGTCGYLEWDSCLSHEVHKSPKCVRARYWVGGKSPTSEIVKKH